MKSVFDVNPNANELICFEDGTCFLTDQAGKCGANDYAKRTGQKSELVKRETEEEKPNEEKTNNKKTKK